VSYSVRHKTLLEKKAEVSVKGLREIYGDYTMTYGFVTRRGVSVWRMVMMAGVVEPVGHICELI